MLILIHRDHKAALSVNRLRVDLTYLFRFNAEYYIVGFHRRHIVTGIVYRKSACVL